jgi:hypothetical protein
MMAGNQSLDVEETKREMEKIHRQKMSIKRFPKSIKMRVTEKRGAK